MGRWRAVAVLLILVAAAGCTPSAGEPPPTPPLSTPTPLPPRPSPTENAIERQERLDYAAAEKSYRAFQDELRRVLRGGGAAELTPVLSRTTGGTFRKETDDVVRQFKAAGRRQEGKQKVVFVRPLGHGEARVVLDVCEDRRQVTTFDRSGKRIGSDKFQRSEITVQESNGSWRLTAADGREVTTCG